MSYVGQVQIGTHEILMGVLVVTLWMCLRSLERHSTDKTANIIDCRTADFGEHSNCTTPEGVGK